MKKTIIPIRIILTTQLFFSSVLLLAGNNNNIILHKVGPVSPKTNSVALSGNLEQLKPFIEAVKSVGSTKIRIGHYGDSMIWGDIISARLRELFQEKFGGNGQGMLSLCADDISIKQTTIHKFSNDWEWASLFTRNQDRLPIGMCGTVSVPGPSSWVEYSAGRASKASREFSQLRIFYSGTKPNSSIKYTLSNNQTGNIELKNGNETFESDVNFGENVSSIKLEMKNCEGAYFYGASLEDGPGVYLDNFALRGNSGVGLSDLDEKVMSQISKELNYKLFILNFGINVVESGKTNYTWYHKKMVKVIKHIQKLFPEAGIILVSSGDRAVKKGSRFVTEPEIKSLINTQIQIAKETKVAFWNMFEAMGGENSMSDYPDSNPPLAYKDYIHLTPEGGNLIGELLFNAIYKQISN